MVAKTNHAGTLASVFSIGKGGPTIRQGSSTPSSGVGVDGDVYLQNGTPGVYLKTSGAWQILTPNALPLSGGTVTGNLTVTGTFSHGGLTLTAGTLIDQLASWNLSLTLTPSWQDTGIKATNLATGTYVVQVTINDTSVGGTQSNEYYSGVMSWYGSDTDEATSDEVVLHRAGVKNAGNAVFLRIIRTITADANDMKLQIAGTNTDTGASSVILKFRRMI